MAESQKLRIRKRQFVEVYPKSGSPDCAALALLDRVQKVPPHPLQSGVGLLVELFLSGRGKN